MDYKVVHRFEMPDGSESKPLNKDEFRIKYEKKLAEWDKGYRFVEMVAESVLQDGGGRVA